MIDNLPNELVPFIFHHLDLLDLITCRQVSKKWRFFIDRIKMTELIILDNDINLKYSWYHTNRRFNYRFMLQPMSIKFFKLFTTQQIFINVKRLNISYEIDWNHFDIENLNNMNQLEQLDIVYIDVRKKSTLKLPILKILYVFVIQQDDPYAESWLTIDTPSLHAVYCGYGLNSIRFTYANTIKWLEVEMCRGDLTQFVCLEALQCNEVLSLSLDVLSVLPSIRQLHLIGEVNLPRAHERTKYIVNYLNKQKMILRRLDLQIYFLGVRLIDGLTFENYNFEKLHWQNHLKNWSLVAPTLPYFDSVNYTDILNIVKTIPEDFFQRMVNIQRVLANKIEDQAHFINFLKRCSNLSVLIIINSHNLTQEFYDAISLLGPIAELHIKEPPNFELNYQFILRMKYLYNFSSNQPLSLDLALNTFTHLNYMRSISFQFDDGVIWIRKSNRKYLLKVWMGQWANHLDKNFVKLHKSEIEYRHLVRLCHNLKNKTSIVTRSAAKLLNPDRQ